MPPGLVERELELEKLRDAFDSAATGSGCVLAIEGSPGIGKSRLLAEARELATERGFVVAAARAGELERDLPWAVVRDLLGEALERATERERARLLAGAARQSLIVLGGTPGAASADATTLSAAMHGLYWLTANLTDRRPVLVAVDDIQWSDIPSLRWLTYLAARVEGLPVLVATAARTGEPQAPEALLGSIVRAAHSSVLRPAGLSPNGTATMMRSRLGDDVDPVFAAASHAATQGNPFLLHELALQAERERLEPTAENAPRVAELEPGGVAESVSSRLADMGEEEQRLADAVAILGTNASLDAAAQLAPVARAEAIPAADALTATHVFAPGTPLDFVHPLVRNAVRARLSPRRAQELHGRAARILADRGRPADQVAVHLLATEPRGDPWTVERLHEAGVAALARGAPAAAAQYLGRAFDEPPSSEARLALLRALGRAQVREHGARGLSAFEEALALASDAETRTEIAVEVARELHMLGDPAAATRLLAPVLDDLDEGSEGAADVEGLFLAGAILDDKLRPTVGERIGRLFRRLDAGETLDRTSLAAMAILVVAAGGSPDRAARLARQSLEGATRSGANATVVGGAACVLGWVDETAEGIAVLDDVIDNARRNGHQVQYASASCWRAHQYYRVGALVEAEADARTSVALYAELGVHPPEPHAFMTDVMLERDEPTTAIELLKANGLDGDVPEHWYANWLLESRGRLRLSLGDVDGAVADLEECGRRVAKAGSTNPALIPWRSSAAIAIYHRGDPEIARGLAESELQDAESFGVARAVGITLRSLGIVTGGRDGIGLLARAVETLARSPSRLEHARALVDLGAASRRRTSDREAVRVLRDGLDVAISCGAIRLADRARSELLAAGARPRRDRLRGRDALTASERRVARMAADGMTNREIAQALFLTRRTVETHLTHAYGKLGITGRTDLPSALSDDG